MLRFGTAGIRGDVRDTVTPEAVARLARAAASEGSTFVVARDGRETSESLLGAAVAGLTSGGASVQQLGILPTPVLAYASRGHHGLMITASHNPPGDNGVKLFVNGREFGRVAEKRIEDHLDTMTPPHKWNEWGHIDSASVLPAYQSAVEAYLSTSGESSSNLSVVLDCGTGTAGLIAPSVLRSLGVSVRTLNGTVDGTFPARPSKPTGDTLDTLCHFMADGPADLGLAFDGDADRIVVVDGDGNIVHEDTVLAILAGYYVNNASVSDPVVVTTPNASNRIDEYVNDMGGRVTRTALGRLHEGIDQVRSDGDEDTSVVFAAEPWKHIHPAFGEWIDGIVSAGMLCRLIGDSPLAERRNQIDERPYLKTSVECAEPKKSEVMRSLEERLSTEFPEGDVDTTYGIRLTIPDSGWMLVRPSGTEPVIRIYVESIQVERLTERVSDIVSDVIDQTASS